MCAICWSSLGKVLFASSEMTGDERGKAEVTLVRPDPRTEDMMVMSGLFEPVN